MTSSLVLLKTLHRSKSQVEGGSDAQTQYDQQVVTSLNAVSEHLLLLADDVTRVETLELLFALLFLKTDDLSERDVVSDSSDEPDVSVHLTSSNSNQRRLSTLDV